MEKQKNDTESKNAETTATVQGLAVQSTKTQMKFVQMQCKSNGHKDVGTGYFEHI